MLRRRGEHAGESFDPMGLLQNLCLVKMDNVDGLKPTSASAMPDNDEGPNSSKENGSKTETEMKGEKRNSFEISLEGVGALVMMWMIKYNLTSQWCLFTGGTEKRQTAGF